MLRIVQLGRGLIAITGETGAGKSLISSAFNLAAGARVRGADMVGNKGPTATVQLYLELGEGHRASTAKVTVEYKHVFYDSSYFVPGIKLQSTSKTAKQQQK